MGFFIFVPFKYILKVLLKINNYIQNWSLAIYIGSLLIHNKMIKSTFMFLKATNQLSAIRNSVQNCQINIDNNSEKINIRRIFE